MESFSTASAFQKSNGERAPTRFAAVHSNPKPSFRSAPLHESAEGNFMKPSYPIKGTTIVPAEGRDLAAKVQAVILPFRLADVADTANRTTEAVKKWRRADTCPDLASSINLARGIPAIKWLIYKEIEGDGAPDGVFSTQLVVKAFALLQQLADGEGEHATAARAILGQQQGRASE